METNATCQTEDEFRTFVAELYEEVKKQSKPVSTIEHINEAVAWEETLNRMLDSHSVLGKSILWALLEAERRSYYMAVGEFNSLREWALERLHHHDDTYLKALVDIVEHVLTVVDQEHNTVVKPDGEVIVVTPEAMLRHGGCVGKLKRMHTAFAAASPEERQRLLETFFLGNRAALGEVCDEILGKEVITIPYRENPLPDGKWQVTLELNDLQLREFKRLLGKSGRILL